MPLITKDYIKNNFPQWQHYAGFDTEAQDDDQALDKQIANATSELAEYVTVSDATITDPLRRHLFHIVRYNLFMLEHADTEFERDPQIVKAYKRSIDMLQQLRDGDRPATPAEPGSAGGTVKMTAKKRRFDSWFRDTGGRQVSSDDPQP